jgi:hypothetical protein
MTPASSGAFLLQTSVVATGPVVERQGTTRTKRRGMRSLKTEQRSPPRRPLEKEGPINHWDLRLSSRAECRIASDQLGVCLSREKRLLLRKEVIQPHLPVRLPCYDFTPIADPTFDGSLLAVGPPASGVADFRGVTGGVYKARERIHPGVADPGLLATPASWSRVADSNPN